MSNFLKTRAGALLALVVLGAALRLAFVHYLGNQLKFPDEGNYFSQAEHLYRYGLHGYADMATDRTPGAGSVIWLAFLAAGPGYLKARVLFALLSALSIFLVYKYAGDLYGPRTALAAAALAAVYPLFIYWSGMLTTENLTVLFITAALFFTGRFAASSGKPFLYGALAGLSWGALILTRGQNLYFLPFLLGWLLWEKTYKKPRALLLFFVLTAAMPSLWMLKNYKESGSFTIDTHGGYALLTNAVYYEETRIDWELALKTLESSELYKETVNMTGGQRDRYFMEKAVQYIKANPGGFLRTRADNFVQFWRFYPRTDLKVVHGSPFLGQKFSSFTLISLLTEPLLILLGLWGLFRAVKQRETRAYLPFLFVLFTAALHTMVYAQMRYRLVLMPILIIFTVHSLAGREPGKTTGAEAA